AQMDSVDSQRPKISGVVQTSIIAINGRDYLVCIGPLRIDRAAQQTLYVFLDITEDRARLVDLMQSLGAAAVLTLVALVITVAIYVKRALRPLRRMSQITAHLKLEELGHVRVKLENAPTEVSELVETCETMLARLAKALEQQRQFTHDISHELRTPLTISYGYLQSLQRRSDNLSPPQRNALNTAIAETEGSIAILEDLLNLARVDSGTLQFSFSDVCVGPLVQKVAEQVETSSHRPITVDTVNVDHEAQSLVVKADSERLRQVLVKLLDNALRYSSPEQPVVLRLTRLDDSVTIQVCDRGIGIPLQDQQRIFAPCYRVDAARNRATGGSGLGLSLVKNLVEGMGGHISVTSELDQGSTFTISLPLLVNADETSHRSRRRRRKTGSVY
ncbi:MAG: HAMP domain-containing sensor histidine kinase, partial [Elainellaceae cyanobacterium]